MPARGARSSRAASRCCPAGVRASRASSTSTRRSRSSATDGAVFAKGLSRYASLQLAASTRGRRTADLPEGIPHEVVHRDDLVVLP